MLPYNAYFSLWVGFVASAYMLSRATRPLDNAGVFTDDNRMPLIGLFFSGLVLMLASIPYVETTNVAGGALRKSMWLYLAVPRPLPHPTVVGARPA